MKDPDTYAIALINGIFLVIISPALAMQVACEMLDEFIFGKGVL